MATRPLFLVTNDDGIEAEGINTLAESLAERGDVFVCAPDRERSAQSQAITLVRPLSAKGIGTSRVAVDGTPADCAMLALQELLPRRPDWVISGINRGANLGTDVLYSGTVGAALEGCITGCESMAVSLCIERQPYHYDTAASLVDTVLDMELEFPLGKDEVINLNVPNVPLADVKGMRTAKLGRRLYEGKMWRREDPRGKTYFWIGGAGNDHEPIPGTDCVILNEGYATLSIIRPDMLDADATARWADRLSMSENK